MLEMMKGKVRETEKGYLRYMYEGMLKLRNQHYYTYGKWRRQHPNLSREESHNAFMEHLKIEMMLTDAIAEYMDKMEGRGYDPSDHETYYNHNVLQIV